MAPCVLRPWAVTFGFALAIAPANGGGNAEIRRHASLYDSGGCPADLRRAARTGLRHHPLGGAVLLNSDPHQPAQARLADRQNVTYNCHTKYA